MPKDPRSIHQPNNQIKYENPTPQSLHPTSHPSENPLNSHPPQPLPLFSLRRRLQNRTVNIISLYNPTPRNRSLDVAIIITRVRYTLASPRPIHLIIVPAHINAAVEIRAIGVSSRHRAGGGVVAGAVVVGQVVVGEVDAGMDGVGVVEWVGVGGRGLGPGGCGGCGRGGCG